MQQDLAGWTLNEALDEFTQATHGALRSLGKTPVVWEGELNDTIALCVSAFLSLTHILLNVDVGMGIRESGNQDDSVGSVADIVQLPDAEISTDNATSSPTTTSSRQHPTLQRVLIGRGSRLKTQLLLLPRDFALSMRHSICSIW
jgi:hypothetical protein